MLRVSASVALIAWLTVANTRLESGLQGAARSDRPELAVGASITRQIATGESHEFDLKASEGDLVNIHIEQNGIDVAVRLLEPDDRLILDINSEHGDVGIERLLVITPRTGMFRVRVAATESSARLGRYTLRLDERRPSESPDLTRVEATRDYERANTLFDRGLPSGFDEALTAYSDALAKYRSVHDAEGERFTLVGMAGVNASLGRPVTLSLANEGEQLARAAGDTLSLARLQRVKGGALERMGDLDGALRVYEGAAVTAHAIADRRLEAITVTAQGIIHGRTGNPEQAIERFEYALSLAQATGFGQLVRGLWNNMGIAYKDIGQLQKSFDAYTKALENGGGSRDAQARILILNNMGNLQRMLGKPTDALALHEQALQLSRETGGRENEARSLNTMGSTYYAMGDYQRALDYHSRALVLRREIRDLPGEAASLNGQAKALHRLGDSARAVALLEESLALRRRIQERFGELDSLHDLAVVERDRGNVDVALGHIRSAVDLEEALRAQITSPDVRTTFRAAEEDKYELFIDLLQRAHAAAPTRGFDIEAITANERARSRVLLESLLDARVDLREGIDAELLARERALQKQISDLSTQVSRALSRSGVESAAALSGRLDRLHEEYAAVQSDIRRQSPRYAAITQPQPATASEIQTSMLDPDTVLLEFALGEERSWLLTAVKTGVANFELPKRREIETAARNLYDLLTARQPRKGESASARARRVAAADAALPAAARTLSRLLLNGVADRLHGEWQSKRLVIVPAGALEYLPLGVLPIPPDSRRPGARATPERLGERHEIVTIPSASVLLAMRRETAARPPARGTVALFADAVFDASDPRIATRRASVTDPLPRLPFSRREAAAIASIARQTRSGSVLQAIGFDASRARLLDPEIGEYRILHIATHGVVDAERPAQTALILSLVDQRGGTRDGYVRMQDIYSMHLGADLVVLSACQTALGQAFKGEGIVGFARAFMYAGAPRVVASLWEVSDVATAELMTRFYDGMLRRGETPAAALHKAQLDMAKDPRWSSPYYWAGFRLQGDWR